MGCGASKIGNDESDYGAYTVTVGGNMDHQGGGHGRIIKCIVNPGKIHALAKPLDHREGESYPALHQTPLNEYVPKYYGNHTINDTECLVIQDLTAGMKSPCLMDLKVGTRHYDLSATEEKIRGQIEKAAHSTTRTHGVRLVDAKIRKNGEVVDSWDRKQGLVFSIGQLKEVIAKFLPTENLKKQYQKQLEGFINAYEKTLKAFPGFRVYGSSLLIGYDGDADLNKTALRLKFIDFAHLYANIATERADPMDSKYDDGVILGAKTLANNIPGVCKYRLVMIRHGESQWNLENRFTGWYDCDLSANGIKEAEEAGRTLKEEGFVFDVAFTSVLKRAIRTLWITLDGMDLMHIPVVRSWRLNERHYGGLTGLNKQETVDKYGLEQVTEWRRSFATPPPPLDEGSEYHPRNDKRYSGVDPSVLPSCESLKTTIDRVIPFWQDEIVPAVKAGKRVIIAAHGNSLRALVKYLEGMGDDEIIKLNIPTAVPLVYELDCDLNVVSKRYVGNQAMIEAKINAVANQTKASK